MKSEEETKIKQSYMRKAIIDAGYDAESFINHLNSAKEDGDDIDNWTLEELKVEVKNYKSKHAKDNNQSNIQSSIIKETSSKFFGCKDSDNKKGIEEEKTSKIKNNSSSKPSIELRSVNLNIMVEHKTEYDLNENTNS